jgi:serine/threonine-protein kinase RsbT
MGLMSLTVSTPLPLSRPVMLAPHVSPFRLPVRTSEDIVAVRQQGRVLALELGFGSADVTCIAAAIWEVARNLVEHGGGGEMTFIEARRGERTGLTIRAHDEGPGMNDAGRAAEYGSKPRTSVVSVGLPGVRLLMDELEIKSVLGRGTTVTLTKWLP